MTDTDRLASAERRLTNLESEQKEQRKLLQNGFDTLNKSIAGLRTDVIVAQNRPHCPDPGACLRLEPQIKSLAERMTTMEEWKNQAIGMIQGTRWTGGVIWAVGGAVITAAVIKFLGV